MFPRDNNSGKLFRLYFYKRKIVLAPRRNKFCNRQNKPAPGFHLKPVLRLFKPFRNESAIGCDNAALVQNESASRGNIPFVLVLHRNGYDSLILFQNFFRCPGIDGYREQGEKKKDANYSHQIRKKDTHVTDNKFSHTIFFRSEYFRDRKMFIITLFWIL